MTYWSLDAIILRGVIHEAAFAVAFCSRSVGAVGDKGRHTLGTRWSGRISNAGFPVTIVGSCLAYMHRDAKRGDDTVNQMLHVERLLRPELRAHHESKIPHLLYLALVVTLSSCHRLTAGVPPPRTDSL